MKIKCPVCDKNKTRIHLKGVESVYSRKPYNIYVCDNCGHFFTHPLPRSNELGKIYTSKYSFAAHSLIDREKKKRAAKYAEYIAASGAKTALEIGCMHGLLLDELEKRGVKAAGIEPDAAAVKVCVDKGLKVTQASLEEYVKKNSRKKSNAIIMSHVLEHIVEPKKQIRLLKKKLTRGGFLVIVVPNSQARTRRAFGRFWGYWQVPIHINHYNRTSLTHLLEKAGFEVENVRYVGADSLFFLSSLANRLGSKNDANTLSLPKKALVKTSSVVLSPWLYLGNEDMMIVARKV